MVHDILFLLMGIALLVAGGNYLTEGARSVALRFHVSTVMIGLTVVALGSSVPDLVVCVTATLSGKTPMALGDVVGANIFDVLLVFGVVALIKPLTATPQMLRTGLPMLTLSALVLFVCGDDRLFDNGATDIINRSDGLLMLAFLVLFMALSIRQQRDDDNAATSPAPQPKPAMRQWLAWVCIVSSLAALVVGGNWVVDGASGIALKAGMTESMVGLTVVAIGSSLPDLATSAIAAAKGEPGIAVGNIVGSCVINIFMILGICSTIHPLDTQSITLFDFAILAVGTILVWVFTSTHSRLSRAEGALLVLGYAAYMWRIIAG